MSKTTKETYCSRPACDSPLPTEQASRPHHANDDLCMAIDGGTTNTRARLFLGGKLLATASREIGVRNVAIAGSTEPLRQAVAECVSETARLGEVRLEELDLLCASGMLTSNLGLREVPHVLAPAGVDELARNVVAAIFADIAPLPIHFVPGIKTLPAPATAENLNLLDIMRGEESEAFGIIEAGGRLGPLCVLLPGSHTKLLHVDDQCRVTGSYTTVGGELMQAMAERTILAGSIDWPPTGSPIWPAVDAGARFAAQWGLLRGGFAVRLADVILHENRAERTWFFMGLVVGSDIGDLTHSPLWPQQQPIFVGGRQPLRSVYAHLLKSACQIAAEELSDSVVDAAAARGAIAIARRFLVMQTSRHEEG